MKQSEFIWKIHYAFSLIKREEIYEASINVIEKDTPSIDGAYRSILHTFRSAVVYHNGMYFDLDTLQIIEPNGLQNGKNCEVVESTLRPFEQLTNKRALNRKEALEIVNNNVLISYQMAGMRLERKAR